MSTAAIVMLMAATFTLFRKRRFYTEVIARWLGSAALWSAGVKLVIHQNSPMPEQQRVYISNHTSTLDVFIIIALSLPNTRFFMKGSFRKIPPLAIIGKIIGNFFTPPQSQAQKRTSCFQRAERILRQTGESVYLSPEGTRIVDGTIGPFNKGVFHLATNLSVPIVPIYIDIPREINPGKGYRVSPGTVHVYMLPEIGTDNWRLDNLQLNKEKVRNIYLEFQKKL
jgi:1-acyl-sn-glycerol-3-phosphate acyltransferase